MAEILKFWYNIFKYRQQPLRDVQFVNTLLTVCRGVVQKIDRFSTGEFVIELIADLPAYRTTAFFQFLRKSFLVRFVVLYDITAVDLLESNYRFCLYYNLLSLLYNFRLFIKLPLFWHKVVPYTFGVISISFLYSSASWLEREVWDMFGIFFHNHLDLRRILTDYGFAGFPLRKDFPTVGFLEVHYDEFKKLVVYDKIRLSQEYRVFNFINPWY